MKSTENFKLNNYSKWLIFICLGCIFFSCKTGSTLADQGAIQKRRYQKGYYVNIKSPLAFNKSTKRLENKAAEPITASLNGTLDYTLAEPTLISPVKSMAKQDSERNYTQNESEIATSEIAIKASSRAIITSVYTNQDVLKSFDPETEYYSNKKLNTLALLSFIFAIISLFIAGIPFGIAALVCGIIGLTQVLSSPDRYKGQGFAIAGIAIGLISVVIVVALLAAM